MKKLLNLKGLLKSNQSVVNPDGHPTADRQSRLTSVLSCLFLLLTLGTGQMWADWYISGWTSLTGYDWGTHDDCKMVNDKVTFSNRSADNYQFKLTDGTNWYGHNNLGSAIGTATISSESGWDNAQITLSVASDVHFYRYNTNYVSVVGVPTTCYVTGNGKDMGSSWCDGKDWSSDASVMTKNSDGTHSIKFTGVPAANGYKLKVTNGSWTYTRGHSDFDSYNSNISDVSDGTDNNIVINLEALADVTIKLDGDKVIVTVEYYYTDLSVTATPSGIAPTGYPTISATSVLRGNSVTVNASTIPTGYNLTWSSSKGSFGNTSVSSTTFTPTANEAVATATYTEKTYNVTVTSNNFSYGTVMSGKTSSQTVSAKHFTSDCAITAESLSGYRFTGWTSTGSVVIADASATSTTIKATATGATVTANFEALPSGQLDIVAGANGQVKKESGSWGSSASYTDINTDQNLNIYAQANTGYHFVNWTKSGDGSITTNAATGVYALPARGSATVTANFAENLHNVTVQYKCGSTTIKTETTESNVGEVTTRNVSAPAIAGYTFSNWTVESGVTATTSTTASPVTIKTNSSGTYTITANYTEDLTSSWKVLGGTNLTGNSWGTEYAMTKKSGHSTEDVVYYTFNISSTNSGVSGAANDWSFKIKNGDTWYGLSADGSYWVTSTMVEAQPLITPGANIQICANVAGRYEVKVDYSTPASPKVSVTFPTSYAVNFSVSPAGAADAPTNNQSLSDGGLVLDGTSVTFTHATANTGYTWSHWEVGGTNVSTGSTYTTTISAATTVTAVYTENSYSTTVSATNGSVSPASPSISHHTGTELTATPNPNYVFESWSVSGGGLAVKSPSTLNSNPATFTATSTGGTITANFADQWAVCGIGSWSTYNGLAYKSDNVYEGTVALTGGNDYEFKVVDRSGSTTYYTAASATTITRAESYVTANNTAGGSANLKITADRTGDYTFTFNTSDKSLTVTYPADPTYTVTVTAGAHGSITTPASGDPRTVSAGQFTPATIVATADDGYVFSRWTVTSGEASDVTIADNTAASTTVTATGNVTLTATFINNWAIAGDDETYFANWSTTAHGFDNFTTVDGKSCGYIDMTLPANTQFTFKVYYHDGGVWYGNNTTTQYMTYAENNNQDWQFETGNDKANCGLTTAGAGTYRFTWNETDKKLRVRFPESYTVTYGKVADNGQNIGGVTVTGDDGDALESGKYVAKGSATFTAAAAANYTFVDWRTSATYGEGTQLSTDNPYTMTSISENKTVYAHYKENMTTVTLAHTGNGSIKIGGATVTSTTAGVVTTRSITAVPDAGYYFSGWTLSETPDFSVSGTGEANSTITVTGLGAGETTGQTLTANFVELDKIFFRNENETTGGKLWDVTKMYVYFGVDWGRSGAEADGVITASSSQAEMNPVSAESNIFWAYVPRSFTTGGNGKVAFSDEWMGSPAYPDGVWGEFYGKQAVYRTDYNTYLNMYVPACTSNRTSNSTVYYDNGYWMKYNTLTDQGASYYLKENTGSGELSEFKIAAPNGTTIYTQYRFQNTSAKTFYIANAQGAFFKAASNVTSVNCTDINLNEVSPAAGFTVTPTSEGYYTFTIDQSGETMKVSVTYPISAGDYRLVYTYTDGGGTKTHVSDVIKPDNASSTNIKKSVYIDPTTGVSLKLHKCTGLNAETKEPIWTETGVSVGTLSTVFTKGKGVYEFDMAITDGTGNGSDVASVSLDHVKIYDGPFYIKTDYAPGGWVNFKQNTLELNTITFDTTKPKTFDYYFCKWIGEGDMNVKCIIANDYNEQITDTLIGDNILGTYYDGVKYVTRQYLAYPANVRFSYNSYTNELKRAYINGATDWQKSFLQLSAGSTVIKDGSGNAFTDNSTTLNDQNNWIYMLDMQAQEGARVKLTANYRFSDADHTQYLIGESGESEEYNTANTEEILGGSGTSWQPIRVIYDFKTNKLISAWLAGGSVSEKKAINTDVLVIRTNQDDAAQINLGNNTNKLTEVDTVYSALCLTKAYLTDGTKTDSERRFYWLSFPYNVRISDIFGSFGTYGEDWIIQRYNGKKRATYGFWLESESNWEYITDESTILNAYEGYVLTLDLSEFDSSSKKWGNSVTQIYEYFPSNTKQKSIEFEATKEITIDQTGYECTINRSEEIGGNGERLGDLYDRRVRDSYWHLIGVPSFANTNITGGFNAHSSSSGWTAGNMPFFYDWDKALNKLSPTSATSGTYFKPMTAYLVQYSSTTITWNAVSAPQPSSVVARHKAEADDIHFIEFNLKLMQEEESLDHTYVRLTDNEDVTTGFEFGQDLCKEFTSGANIYTMIDQLQVAGNSLPLETEKTTIVPVGVRIATAGEYTFAMPEGTEGTGVVLVDNTAGTRTNLALGDYTVTLGAGTTDGRFVLEISPIANMPTGIEAVSAQPSEVRKVMVDGVLYIVKDGKVYDAQGTRVK